ncbi:MAG: SUMF1/EgtB/PvdO family nonheme iron enzyme [Verrucomicrobiota bacterium]|nr:SUMF1/EgtB/PvdO family nonheme iron enzyme [Verrucomicrobiota bacterium]
MEQLGDYIVQKQLGYGPFGAVSLAEHRFIKRLFVLKVLPEEISSNSQFLRRFEMQVAEIAALDHPNILKIHNVSIHNDRAYLVVDPVVDSLGETMNFDRFLELKGKTFSEQEQLELLRQVASAIDYAHEAGVAHGGLKLTNVLVAPEEQGVKLFLSDFGISRLVGEGVAFLRLTEQIAKALMPNVDMNGEKAIHASRTFLKNFAFLAPEQKALKHDTALEKCDAYAFGVLAYYVLLGKLPEGCFDLPSRVLGQHSLNWDFLINRCLQINANVRPQKLLSAMDEYLKAPRSVSREMQSLSEIEQKVDSVLQMAFEFPAKGEAALAKAAASAAGATMTPKPMLKPAEIARPEFEADPGAIFQREMLVSHYEPKKEEVSEIEPLLTEMVVVPGGQYLRGSNEGARDEMPRHAVQLPSFALDIHAVTNDQFVRFLQAMGGEKDRNNNDIIRLRDSRIKRVGGRLIIESGYAKHPVVGVTWYGATAYARWVGKRLPTEAEWEAAATGGRENFLYPTGNDIERSQSNFFSSDTTPVMSYPPNPFGFFDMAGNVYEWCQDWYAYNYYDASALEPTNPLGPPQGVYRVLRGGCWKSLKEDLRCSHRHRNNPGAVNGTYGFRCAADVS